MTTRRLALATLPFASLGASLLALAPLPASAQHAPASALEAYRRATALVDAAVAAHGGVEALRAARHLRVTLAGHDFHRNQSRRVAAPYDSTVRRHDLMLDLARGRLVQEQTRGYPGGFVYTRRFITDSARSYGLDLRARTYLPTQWPPADRQLGNLFMLPHFYLLAALETESPGQRQWLGRRRIPGGAVVEAVAVSIPEGGQVTLGFDPATHRLRALLSVAGDALDGDTEVVSEYPDYRELNGVLLPTRWITRRAGEVASDLAYTSATPGWEIPDSLRAPPAGFTELPPPPPEEPVRELAPGVWGVRGGGAWSLVVAFADHLLVVDAPPRGAPEVLARAATLAPGKPVRFVVPTHHHDDHFGGVRHYAAAGATVVTTPGNLDYARRILAAPPSSLAAWLGPAAPDARVEVIEGRRRVFTDGTRTVELRDIGPSPHADEMLVAWLPAEGILFQGDLIEAPPTGQPLPGANSETTVHLAGWLRRQGWPVRTFAGAHAFLANPAAFEELVRQEIVPPE